MLFHRTKAGCRQYKSVISGADTESVLAIRLIAGPENNPIRCRKLDRVGLSDSLVVSSSMIWSDCLYRKHESLPQEPEVYPVWFVSDIFSRPSDWVFVWAGRSTGSVGIDML